MALHNTKSFSKTLGRSFEIPQSSLRSRIEFLVILIEFYSSVRTNVVIVLISFNSWALIEAKKRSRSRGIFFPFLEETAPVFARNPNNSVWYVISVGTIMPPAVVALHAEHCWIYSPASWFYVFVFSNGFSLYQLGMRVCTCKVFCSRMTKMLWDFQVAQYLGLVNGHEKDQHKSSKV